MLATPNSTYGVGVEYREGCACPRSSSVPASPRPPRLPRGDDWLHEPKLDGYRFRIVKDEHVVDVALGETTAALARADKGSSEPAWLRSDNRDLPTASGNTIWRRLPPFPSTSSCTLPSWCSIKQPTRGRRARRRGGLRRNQSRSECVWSARPGSAGQSQSARTQRSPAPRREGMGVTPPCARG